MRQPEGRSVDPSGSRPGLRRVAKAAAIASAETASQGRGLIGRAIWPVAAGRFKQFSDWPGGLSIAWGGYLVRRWAAGRRAVESHPPGGIGRGAGRERGENSGVGGSLKK